MINKNQIKIGSKANIVKQITEEDIENFSNISLDNNPVHLNEEYARNTIFNTRIAHGILVAGLISAVLGTKLPGEGSIYLGQTLEFLKPVYIGDTISAEVEIIDIIENKSIYILKTICKNQKNEIVIKGEAKILKK